MKSLTELEEIPNVGPVIAGKLRRLGVERPEDLRGRDPYELYDALCRREGRRVDCCVLDVFISAVELVNGGPARPWWEFTAQRKRRLAAREQSER